MKKKEKIVIRLVDDDADQRSALKFLLESAGYEVQEFESGQRFLIEDEPWVNGCCIFDLQMPEMDGLTLLSKLKQRGYTVPIIFLSAHGDIPSTVEAMKNGSLDFLEKPVDAKKLCALLASILEQDGRKRNSGLSSEQARKLLSQLSPRRLAVANLIAQGLLKREVAERLGINLKTVESHCLYIYSFLDVHSVAELSALIESAELEY